MVDDLAARLQETRAVLRRLHSSRQLSHAQLGLLEKGLVLAEAEARGGEGAESSGGQEPARPDSHRATWSGLPTELLREVAKSLNLWDFGGARRVCARWNRLLPLIPTENSWLSFWQPPGSAAGWAGTICRLLPPDSKSLCLEPYAGCGSALVQSEYVRKVVERMPQVTDLRLRVAGLTEKAVEALGALTGLTRLEMPERTQFVDEDRSGHASLSCLCASLTQLRSLTMDWGRTGPPEDSLVHLTGLAELQELNLLSGVIRGSDLCAILSALPSLTQLRLKWCDLDSDDGTRCLQMLSRAPQLQILKLPSDLIPHGPGWSQPLLHLTRLTELDLQCYMDINSEFHVELRQTLRQLTKLTALRLGCLLGGGSLQWLAALTALRVLDLSESLELEEETLDVLMQLTCLEALHLPHQLDAGYEWTGQVLDWVPSKVHTLSLYIDSTAGREWQKLRHLSHVTEIRVDGSERLDLPASIFPETMNALSVSGNCSLSGLHTRDFRHLQTLEIGGHFDLRSLFYLPRGLQVLLLHHTGQDEHRVGYGGLPPGLQLLLLGGQVEEHRYWSKGHQYTAVDLGAVALAAPKLRSLMLCHVAASDCLAALCGLPLLQVVAAYDCAPPTNTCRRHTHASLELLREVHPNSPSVRILKTRDEFTDVANHLLKHRHGATGCCLGVF